jgi:hypothetical protein
MLGEKYTLDIRPTFIDELDRAAAYIEQHLCNPIAADKLVADVYDAIDRTLDYPLATAPRYRPPDVLQPYYAILVGNYTDINSDLLLCSITIKPIVTSAANRGR